MANTFTFKQVLNGSTKFKINSGPWHIIEDTDRIDQAFGSGSTVYSIEGKGPNAFSIVLAVDTTITDRTATGGTVVTWPPNSNPDAVYDDLNPLFKKASSFGGTTASANNIDETATRVFVTPAQKTAIGTNTTNIANNAAAIANLQAQIDAINIRLDNTTTA